MEIVQQTQLTSARIVICAPVEWIEHPPGSGTTTRFSREHGILREDSLMHIAVYVLHTVLFYAAAIGK